jgi:NAD(P)-dependent dehydrogenase (short-subunit alcohol dehydrogenase family)
VAELTGKTALVTGAASGIGAATVRALAAAGAKVAVADINATGAEEVAVSLREGGAQAVGIGVDVSDAPAVSAAVTRTVHELGSLDILHNNAAATSSAVLGRDTSIHQAELDVWEKTMAVGLTGYLLCTKYALPYMLERGAGVIINTASAAGLLAATHPAYGVSKAAVIGFTRNVATLYGKRGIRCVGVAPGLIMTPAAEANVSKEVQRIMLRHHLTPRLGRPEDLAEAVVFLASDRAGFITGVTIPVDGGFSAHSPTYAEEMDLAAESD